MIKLFVSEVVDRFARENFQKILDLFRSDPFRKGQYLFKEITIANRGSFPQTLTFAHGLTFQPKDVIAISVRDPDTATVTWNYDAFTRTHVSLTASAACTVRAYIGRHEEQA